jgi:hypothetical protein
MIRLELVVEADAYELCEDGRLLARMSGGASTLLPGAPSRLREIDMEAAIERAEDWLMPFCTAPDDHQLLVLDKTGRIFSFFDGRSRLSPAEVEQAFTRMHDAVAHQRAAQGDVMADVVLLREFVHHARLAQVELHSAPPGQARLIRPA